MHFMDEGALPRSRHPGHTRQRTQEEHARRSPSGSWPAHPMTSNHPTFHRVADVFREAREPRSKGLPNHFPVSVSGLPHRGLEAALRHEPAALAAGPRPQLDEGVGLPHGLGVMLHDDDGIALAPELLEAGQEPFIIHGMEADGGFIEDVADPSKVRPQLRCQADALRFPAGKGVTRAVQGQIVQPTFRRNKRPRLDFPRDGAGNGLLLSGKTKCRATASENRSD